MFGDAEALIPYRMSEYMEIHRVAPDRSPPATWDTKEGSASEAVPRRRPYSVVLSMRSKRLIRIQCISCSRFGEEGKITDTLAAISISGHDYHHYSRTSASEVIKRQTAMGFGTIAATDRTSDSRQDSWTQSKRCLNSEFLNRLDDMIVFAPARAERP